MIMLDPLAARVKKPVGIFGSGLFAIKPPSHLSNKENQRLLYLSHTVPITKRSFTSWGLLRRLVETPFWVIPHNELLRFQREGLLPDRRRQPNTASTA